MTKAGEELIKAATEALEITHGQADPESYRVHLPDEINARLIRSQLNMTQGVFAQTFGIDIRTLQEGGSEVVGIVLILLQLWIKFSG